MDDSALLAEYVRSGSQQHFATLVNRHVNWVYSVCRRQAGAYLAEDVTQAVFATLARKAAHIRAGTSITGWLFKTARYASATACKIERRRREHERKAAAMNPSQTSPPADQDWQQILPELDAAVARLSESDRRAILLRFYEGLSHEDAAAVMGVSTASAQRRVSRAVEKLRIRLQKFSFVVPGMFEPALQNRLITPAPPQVVSASISVAGEVPSAQVELIMKGTIIMRRLYTLKLVGIAASLLVIAGAGIFLVLPAQAVSSAANSTQTASPARVSTVEFHIIANEMTAPAADLKAMDARLAPGGAGPQPQPGDTIRWVEVEHPESFDRPGALPETRQWNGVHFMPLLITPDASMVQSGMQGWNFVNIHSEIQNGNAVAFSFDSRGAKLFGDLTMRWYNVVRRRSDNSHARLAIMLDNKIISAPNINTPITGGSGVITGEGPGGFTRDEMDRLISAMNSGAQPATQPASPLKSGN